MFLFDSLSLYDVDLSLNERQKYSMGTIAVFLTNNSTKIGSKSLKINCKLAQRNYLFEMNLRIILR